MRTYDEHALLAKLELLDRRAKTVFAVSCAQRLFPLFERYAPAVRAPALSERLAEIVAAGWDLAATPMGEVQRMEAEATSMVPDEDDDGWVRESAYAQNAAAAVAYAMGAWRTDDPQQAVWAATQLYEAADYAFWQANPDADLNDSGAALGSGFVQAALTAMDEDLAIVASSASSALSWVELRRRADTEGRAWAATLP